MAKILYLPIPTAEAREMVDAWNAGRVAKLKQPYRVIECRFVGAKKAIKHAVGMGDLRNIGANDTLIVLAHGLKPNAHIEDHSYPAVAVGMSRNATKKIVGLGEQWDGGVLKHYSPNSLARHLRREGLTRQIGTVTLFACSGAATMSNNNFTPFAQRFKASLVNEGFNNVNVVGYDGDLAISYNLRRHNGQQLQHKSPNFHHPMTAHHHKGVYDPLLDDFVPSKCGRVVF
jgi:hypothetical protein